MIFAYIQSMFAKSIRLSVFVASFFAMNSCFIADGYLVEEKPAPQPPLQKSCQRSIENYITDRISNEVYRAYKFTDAVIYVPQELLELEKLEVERETGVVEGDYIDTMIAQKRRYLEANNIQRTAELDHFFALKTKSGDLNIVEATYTLNDTFAVIDYDPKIILTIPDSYEQALIFFMNNYTIFYSADVVEARKLSTQFYSFFKSRLETFEQVDQRSAFFLNCLKITEMVRMTATFDPNQIAKSLVIDHMIAITDTSWSYSDIEFSPLYQKSQTGTEQGYYIFHKFRETNGEITDTLVWRFDLSAYYEIETKTNMNPPFDPYFNK